MDKNIDIPKLTREAELGNGCNVYSQILNLSDQEQFKVMQEIVKQNARNRQVDKALPELTIGTTIEVDQGWRIYGTGLRHDPPGMQNREMIVNKEYLPTANKFRSTCTNRG